MESPGAGDDLQLRRNLVAAVGTAVRFFKPFLDAVVAKNMLTLGETQRCFDHALRALLTEVVVADDASCG